MTRLAHDTRVDALVHAGHSAEHCRLQHNAVVQQLACVTCTAHIYYLRSYNSINRARRTAMRCSAISVAAVRVTACSLMAGTRGAASPWGHVFVALSKPVPCRPAPCP
jgi:hypothetical protein